uniref:Uncharacterized protein n=1 Tax=Oryza barthii TaxID=65489 RepID=A0A0D3F313_9ORYZ
MVLSRAWYLRHDIVQCRGGEGSGGEGGGGGGVAVELEAPGTTVVCVGRRREQQRSAETGGGGATETLVIEAEIVGGYRVIEAEIVGGADGMEEGEGERAKGWEGISEAGVGVLGDVVRWGESPPWRWRQLRGQRRTAAVENRVWSGRVGSGCEGAVEDEVRTEEGGAARWEGAIQSCVRLESPSSIGEGGGDHGSGEEAGGRGW